MHNGRHRTLLAVGLAVAVLGGCTSSSAPAGASTASAASTSAPQSAAAVITPEATAAALEPAPDGAQVSADAGAPAQPGPSGQVEAAQSGPAYTIEQAVSDKAQATTIAFDALGFLTGNLGADSFFPPGKVADFWGFQYLRDNDPSAMGHNTDFLTRASMAALNTMTAAQRAQLVTLAKSQVSQVQAYAQQRFVLMAAFRRNLSGTLPTGTTGLSQTAVQAYSARLYRLDGAISLARARVMGSILANLTSAQRATFDAMVGKGMTSWPVTAEPTDVRGLDRAVKELVMTYAGDVFSWYAGSITADTYFCPERHGTYFGSFYLKDAPAVGNPGYSIDTTLTANLGTALLAALDTKQAATISGLVDAQRPALTQIVATRKAISTELRKLQTGGTVDAARISSLMTTYGKLDGELVYRYATAFAQVGKTLTTTEKAALNTLRAKLLGTLSLPTGAYLYSTSIAMPSIPSTDFLFH